MCFLVVCWGLGVEQWVEVLVFYYVDQCDQWQFDEVVGVVFFYCFEQGDVQFFYLEVVGIIVGLFLLKVGFYFLFVQCVKVYCEVFVMVLYVMFVWVV